MVITAHAGTPVAEIEAALAENGQGMAFPMPTEGGARPGGEVDRPSPTVRGLRLADEVVDFLLRHGRRELSSLRNVLDALDAASLERKRPITLPLLREMIQHGLEI